MFKEKFLVFDRPDSFKGPANSAESQKNKVDAITGATRKDRMASGEEMAGALEDKTVLALNVMEVYGLEAKKILQEGGDPFVIAEFSLAIKDLADQKIEKGWSFIGPNTQNGGLTWLWLVNGQEFEEKLPLFEDGEWANALTIESKTQLALIASNEKLALNAAEKFYNTNILSYLSQRFPTLSIQQIKKSKLGQELYEKIQYSYNNQDPYGLTELKEGFRVNNSKEIKTYNLSDYDSTLALWPKKPERKAERYIELHLLKEISSYLLDKFQYLSYYNEKLTGIASEIVSSINEDQPKSEIERLVEDLIWDSDLLEDLKPLIQAAFESEKKFTFELKNGILSLKTKHRAFLSKHYNLEYNLNEGYDENLKNIASKKPEKPEKPATFMEKVFEIYGNGSKEDVLDLVENTETSQDMRDLLRRGDDKLKIEPMTEKDIEDYIQDLTTDIEVDKYREMVAKMVIDNDKNTYNITNEIMSHLFEKELSIIEEVPLDRYKQRTFNGDSKAMNRFVEEKGRQLLNYLSLIAKKEPQLGVLDDLIRPLLEGVEISQPEEQIVMNKIDEIFDELRYRAKEAKNYSLLAALQAYMGIAEIYAEAIGLSD